MGCPAQFLPDLQSSFCGIQARCKISCKTLLCLNLDIIYEVCDTIVWDMECFCLEISLYLEFPSDFGVSKYAQNSKLYSYILNDKSTLKKKNENKFNKNL